MCGFQSDLMFCRPCCYPAKFWTEFLACRLVANFLIRAVLISDELCLYIEKWPFGVPFEPHMIFGACAELRLPNSHGLENQSKSFESLRLKVLLGSVRERVTQVLLNWVLHILTSLSLCPFCFTPIQGTKKKKHETIGEGGLFLWPVDEGSGFRNLRNCLPLSRLCDNSQFLILLLFVCFGRIGYWCQQRKQDSNPI